MKQVTWLSIPAILLTFIFIFVPAFLWLIDRIFRKPLGYRLFHVQWRPWWIIFAVLLWVADQLWVHFL